MVGKDLMLRIQAREGTKRVEISPNETAKRLFEKIKSAFSYNSYAFNLHKDRQKLEPIASNSKTVGSLGLKHGDLIYLSAVEGMVLTPETPSSSSSSGIDVYGSADEKPGPSSAINNSSSSTNISLRKGSKPVVGEDEVDQRLSAQDGLIHRPKDPNMCRHGDKGRCVFCLPLEPYDENYLREHNIKHLSFHSYIKKLTAGDKAKFTSLEDISARIKEGCTTHPPWPRGICSKCQPSAVTLNRQVYRHVDNVMFENPHIVERFLSYWRASGHQRMGFLFGSYEEHTDVPLGIRARVAAIYEPPQETNRDFIRFLEHDEKAKVVEEIASMFGLRCVGWVFTDLIPEDTKKGTVRHLRGIHSYFVSAQECITAAYFQTLHPNPCRLSSSGTFGSKFATVLITGDEKNQVQMVGYQVSNQCMSLVKDKCLVPTKDAPELGYIKESSEKQYVPDVFYKQKDEYGNEVTRMARPLPVEYLLVDVPVSTPIEPQFSFVVPAGKKPFPVENRLLDDQIQDFTALATYLNQFPVGTPFLTIASDFHFLVYISNMDVYPLKDYIAPLVDAIRTNNIDAANDWAASDHWLTVKSLVEASTVTASTSAGAHSVGVGSGSSGSPMVVPQSTWTCSHCTYINDGSAQHCEMCSLPRG
ncbi:unnamed protein product [Allacma fusca]|uniref:Nuclear protein localization protein 4 homolog n=1 Tax=Allacma fusca TaxID=39272 RepID=A0A8J2P7C4_9HEXA|nr:unnamed protein product [Allacma fusca]